MLGSIKGTCIHARHTCVLADRHRRSPVPLVAKGARSDQPRSEGPEELAKARVVSIPLRPNAGLIEVNTSNCFRGFPPI